MTTDPGVTTTWDPDQTVTTTSEITTTAPEETTTVETTSGYYSVKGSPSGPWNNGSGAVSNVASMDGWNAQIIVQSDPLSGKGNPVTVSCYVQTWHDSSPTNTITNHMFLALAGAVHSTIGSFASHVAGIDIPEPDETIDTLLQSYEDPAGAAPGVKYDAVDYYITISVSSTDFSTLSSSPYHDVTVTATLWKEIYEDTYDRWFVGELTKRYGGTYSEERISIERTLRVERVPN